MKFKAAMIQMLVEGGRKSENLARAEARIAEAAAQGAALAVLPEALDLGWTHPTAREEAEPIPEGEASVRLSQAAARHDIHVCAGLTERDGDRVYNAAVLFDSQGKLVASHRKINELKIGHESYDPGTKLEVFSTELGAVGLMICADAFAVGEVLSNSLGYLGADIILSPCAWAVPADFDHERTPYGELWRRVYKPVARDFSLWILGVSNVGPLDAGPWAGRKCIGCSLAVNAEGIEIAEGPFGEDADVILYVDVETKERPARGCGWEEHWGEDIKQ